MPARGNLYRRPVPAWIHVGNGYGKLIGETQVREFGELETPILLTCTLCVWRAADALKEWVYRQPGMGEHTVSPVVGETNDARVNNMWANPITAEHVTDAPLTARGLDRVAQRAMMGLARTGSFAHNGSGDYVIAFSTSEHVRRPRSSAEPVPVQVLVNEALSPLFAATAEATEEAIYNAMLTATTVSSTRGTLEAIPIPQLLEVLERYDVLQWDQRLPPRGGQPPAPPAP